LRGADLAYDSQIRFLNNQTQGNNINSEQAAMSLIQNIKFSGKSEVYALKICIDE